MKTLISVSEAKQLIKEQIWEKRSSSRILAEAANSVLAESVYAYIDIPAFHQSSMDGFAFAFQDWEMGKSLLLTTEIPAGRTEPVSLKAGQAARIFTGAALPVGADTVVMQEKTTVKGKELYIDAYDQLIPGAHTREKGAEIKAGQLALAKGSVLTPAAIGFIGAIGVAEVKVYTQPSVAILITGNELQQPGHPLQFGQVYEASSAMLRAVLSEMGIRNVFIYPVSDDLEVVEEIITKVLNLHDVILTTGGVSVGDYDFVVPAAIRAGIIPLFHKVLQRPGKPLFFGRKGNIPFFGLPGNPSSVLTCFYEYVWPLLIGLMGYDMDLKKLYLPLNHAYEKKDALTHFLKGHVEEHKVQILTGQESFRLGSFAQASCLVALPESPKTYQIGEEVEVHILPCYIK